MSRSHRKPIIKDRPRNYKKSTLYWRKIRRNWNTSISNNRYNPEDIDLDDPKNIICDYDYCDYIFFTNNDKYTRK